LLAGATRPAVCDQLAQALTFAEVAVTTLLDRQADAGPGAAADRLAEAMESRIELFQAQGMVMVELSTPSALQPGPAMTSTHHQFRKAVRQS
jgi:hypothetical protein